MVGKEKREDNVKIRWFESSDDRDSTLFGLLAFALAFYMLREFKIELKEVIATLAGTLIGSVTTIIAYHFREKRPKNNGGNDSDTHAATS